MDRLSITRGRDKGRTFDLPADREVVIGRLPECDVQLGDPRASRRHCALYRGVLGYIVKDLGGVNGTFLNGVRIREAQLRAGDLLRVGATEIELLLGEGAGDARPKTKRLPDEAAGAAAGPAPAPAPAPDRRAAYAATVPPAPRGAPPAAGAGASFCAHCLKDITPKEVEVSLARRADGQVLCAECLAERVAKEDAARVAENIIGAQPSSSPTPVPAIPTPARLRPPQEGLEPTPERGTPAAAPAPAPAAAPERRPATGTGARRAVGTASRRAVGTAHRATVRYRPVTRGQQIRTWISLAIAVAVIVICLGRLSDAWLNFRNVLDPKRFVVQRVDVEPLARSGLGITLGYTVKPAEGPEVKSVRSGGPIMRLQYDELARLAEAAKARPQFEVVYDTRDPRRNCLFDRMRGLPPLLIGLMALLWGGWDVWKLVRFFRQEREERGNA